MAVANSYATRVFMATFVALVEAEAVSSSVVPPLAGASICSPWSVAEPKRKMGWVGSGSVCRRALVVSMRVAFKINVPPIAIGNNLVLLRVP